jgi:hypothetical protein
MRSRITRFASVASALAALAGATSAAHAVNLLTNGSFEQPVSTVNQYAAIPGWTRTCGTSIEIQSVAGTGLNAANGTQWWESDGVNNTCLTQTVPTAFNGVYTLTFAHSPRPGVLNNTVEVYWDGSLISTINANGVGNSINFWRIYSFNVVATGSSSTVEFRAAGPSDQVGGYIDGVSLDTYVCPTCPGDADGNGAVNFADITSVLANFGSNCGVINP